MAQLAHYCIRSSALVLNCSYKQRLGIEGNSEESEIESHSLTLIKYETSFNVLVYSEINREKGETLSSVSRVCRNSSIRSIEFNLHCYLLLVPFTAVQPFIVEMER